MDKYINQLFMALSQKYKVTVITIMTYNDEYKRSSKFYKLVIDKKTKKSKYPEERISIDINGKRALVLEMMKWVKETEEEN